MKLTSPTSPLPEALGYAEPIPWHRQGFSAEITLPPMGVLWLVPEEKPKP